MTDVESVPWNNLCRGALHFTAKLLDTNDSKMWCVCMFKPPFSTFLICHYKLCVVLFNTSLKGWSVGQLLQKEVVHLLIL